MKNPKDARLTMADTIEALTAAALARMNDYAYYLKKANRAEDGSEEKERYTRLAKHSMERAEHFDHLKEAVEAAEEFLAVEMVPRYNR